MASKSNVNKTAGSLQAVKVSHKTYYLFRQVIDGYEKKLQGLICIESTRYDGKIYIRINFNACGFVTLVKWLQHKQLNQMYGFKL